MAWCKKHAIYWIHVLIIFQAVETSLSDQSTSESTVRTTASDTTTPTKTLTTSFPSLVIGENCTNSSICIVNNSKCRENECRCQDGFFELNNITCLPEVGLGSDCTQDEACNDTNAECNQTCVCQSGYYDDNGVNVTGGNCTSKVDLGSECPQPEACLTTHAECGISPNNKSGICVCREGYYDTNGTELGGECRNVTYLKVTAINYTTITNDSISITWNESVYSEAVNYYIVEHNSSVGVKSQTVGKNTSATLTDLDSGQRYSIKIKSVNTDTASSERSTYVEYFQISQPNTPGKLIADNTSSIDASSGNITLTWTDPAGVKTGYIGFLENAMFKYNQTFNTSGTIHNQTFSGVRNGTWYNFTVQSISGYNDTMTLYSEVHKEFIRTKVQAPDPPVDIQCSDRTDTYIKLMWNASGNPNGDLRHFIININKTGPGPEIAYNVTTPKADMQYDVENLTEGSFYTFQIYTVNEEFQSTSASKEHYCETRANMSEAPTNVSVSNVTSRSFTISWNKPDNALGELIGYNLIISYAEGTKDCVVEEFINCSTGCKSDFPNETVISPTCNKTNIGYQSVDKTGLLSRRNFTSSFNPDTVYMVSIAAVNQGGKGHTENIKATTLEEAPQKPYNVSCIYMGTTNATIQWKIDLPPPGKTNYTIIVTGESPAENKIHTISGFSNTLLEINDLQEYWNYTLTVNASTIEGSNQSDPVTFKTNASASGIVSKLSVAEGSGGDNYATAKVSWSLPGILERNGPIKGFIIQQEEMINGTFSEITKRNLTSVNEESHTYSTDFQVQRKQLYRFNVFAYNGFDGKVSSMNFSASPVQPPPSVEALAGGIAGGAAALIVIVVIIVLWQRKRKNLKKASRLLDDATESNMENLIKLRRERPINLANFSEYVADYHKDSNLKFSQEYDELKTLSPQHAHEAADMEENRLKNRFVNILPFDHSRVQLLPIDDVPGSDYINANFLPGFTKTREYIGCQGPIPATIDDHWRMIWEQNVRVIVMLTQYKEENRVKCEPYMPLDLKDPKQYGDLVVECLTYSSMNSFEYRTLKIRVGGKERTIKHFHFLCWRDYSANVQFDTMIDFIKTVRKFMQPPDKEGPMIVHCSAGVGRTGTYITLDYVIQHIDNYGTDSTVDIFNFVLKLRENRTTMVQTEQQYIFIHDCIQEYLNRFKTYENQGFSNEDENVYQNTEAVDVYQNMNFTSFQNTEL